MACGENRKITKKDLKGWRILRENEIVRKYDEVLNQYGDDFCGHHAYSGKKVKDCVGALSGVKRVFRRKRFLFAIRPLRSS